MTSPDSGQKIDITTTFSPDDVRRDAAAKIILHNLLPEGQVIGVEYMKEAMARVRELLKVILAEKEVEEIADMLTTDLDAIDRGSEEAPQRLRDIINLAVQEVLQPARAHETGDIYGEMKAVLARAGIETLAPRVTQLRKILQRKENVILASEIQFAFIEACVDKEEEEVKRPLTEAEKMELFILACSEAVEEKPLPLKELIQRFGRIGINFQGAYERSYTTLQKLECPGLTKQEFERCQRISERQMKEHERFAAEYGAVQGYERTLLFLPGRPYNELVRNLRVPINTQTLQEDILREALPLSMLPREVNFKAITEGREAEKATAIGDASECLLRKWKKARAFRTALEKGNAQLRGKPRVVQTLNQNEVQGELFNSTYLSGHEKGFQVLDLAPYLLFLLHLNEQKRGLTVTTEAILGNVFIHEGEGFQALTANMKKDPDDGKWKVFLNRMGFHARLPGNVQGGIMPCVG